MASGSHQWQPAPGGAGEIPASQLMYGALNGGGEMRRGGCITAGGSAAANGGSSAGISGIAGGAMRNQSMR